MKMKQAGLRKKPMYVVPNHLLEQFAREFMQLYPNARLLVATKEDLTRERRKFLTAKIASGEWDGIIVTHSSFERIGMSRDYQEKFLLEQIAEYEELLREHAAAKGANRNLIKTIEKQKAARVERLKDLLAEDKKDDGLVFDELGVDYVFIDEAHLIFQEASDALLQQIETVVKLIRSKGVGIFFCTQNPMDIPASVLSQLGLKVQHALRAFTAADRKSIKQTAENYPETNFYKTEDLITQLGIGEALITSNAE